MRQINLIQGKGGQGTSVTACAVALRAALHGMQVRLDGHDRTSLADVLDVHGDANVIPGLVLAAANGERFDLVVHDGPSEEGINLLVVRPCYLSLRQAVNLGVAAAGVVMVAEPGRALDAHDIAALLGLPVIATIPVRAEIARAVDAGVLADRLPEPLATAAARILEFATAETSSRPPTTPPSCLPRPAKPSTSSPLTTRAAGCVVPQPATAGKAGFPAAPSTPRRERTGSLSRRRIAPFEVGQRP